MGSLGGDPDDSAELLPAMALLFQILLDGGEEVQGVSTFTSFISCYCR